MQGWSDRSPLSKAAPSEPCSAVLLNGKQATKDFYLSGICSIVSKAGLMPFITSPLLVVATVLLTGIIPYWLFIQYGNYRALQQFKGPWPAGWTRLWLALANSSGSMHLWFKDVNDRYGSTARVGPKYLITSDPALMRRMSAVRSSYTRGDYYTALRLHPTRDNITSLRDEKEHDELRYRMAPGYSGKENDFLETTIDERLRKLCGLIATKFVSSSTAYRPVDLSRVATFFTLDTISAVAFGKTFGFLERNADPFGYIEQLKGMLPAMMTLSTYPEMQKLLRLPIMQKVMPKATDTIGLGKVMGFAREVVAERFPVHGQTKPQVVRRDMLGSFKEHGLSQEELESETLTQITAGSDSSATAIRMTVFHIVTNPACERRLIQELSDAGYGPVSGDEDSIIPDADARNLPYLQACIKEGLRLYPPVTGMLSKQTPVEGDTIEVRYADGSSKALPVPGGVNIAWNSYSMMRVQSIFGEDADVWRPERFLEIESDPSSAARVKEMSDTVGLVFGYGRFGCLGRPVAIYELNKAVPELVRRFTWKLVHPEKPWNGTCSGFWIAEGMDFVVEER